MALKANTLTTMIDRPCVYEADHAQLADLITAYRRAADVRLYPTLWRVRLLLTSRVWEPALDTRVWHDATGRLIGLAFLWRRHVASAYVVLERFVRPNHTAPELAAAMLEWGEARAHALAASMNTPLNLYAPTLDPTVWTDEDLTAHGFARVPSDPIEHDVYFARALINVPSPSLPAGYTVRQLRGMEEWEAYQAVYGFAAVNPQHQRELLASDEYQHWVVADAAGAFAAYCEVSICRAEWDNGAERMGWIDYVGTRPEHQRLGLGRAALVAGLAQLTAWGAHTALLVTISTNVPAVGLYHATGFEPLALTEMPSYEKLIPVRGDV